MIEIQLKGPKGINKLTSLPEELQNHLLQGLEDGMLLVERTSKTRYLSGPYPFRLSVDTGNLRKRLMTMATRSNVPGEFARGRIGVQGAFYAKVHEQTGEPGTDFIINAKSSKGMSFFWKRMGFWIYHAHQVRIPARPFLKPAIIDNLEKITGLLNAMIRRAYRKAAEKS